MGRRPRSLPQAALTVDTGWDSLTGTGEKAPTNWLVLIEPSPFFCYRVFGTCWLLSVSSVLAMYRALLADASYDRHHLRMDQKVLRESPGTLSSSYRPSHVDPLHFPIIYTILISKRRNSATFAWTRRPILSPSPNNYASLSLCWS